MFFAESAIRLPLTFHLSTRLTAMEETHKGNLEMYEKHEQSRQDSNNSISRLEGCSGDNAERYQFLQEMRGYVQDLLECFREKVRMQPLSVCFRFFLFLCYSLLAFILYLSLCFLSACLFVFMCSKSGFNLVRVFIHLILLKGKMLICIPFAL